MKYFVRILNLLILLVIPAVVLRTDASQVNKIDFISETRYVKTAALPKVEIKKEEVKPVIKEEKVAPKKVEVKQPEVLPAATQPEPQENNNTNNDSDVIRTLTGSMSGYGPDCVGCGGRTATGFDLRSSIYYSDPTYGNVRILAGDKSLPFGTMVRIKNSKLGTFYGIVLDRGGGIGIGRRHMFDLAFDSERSASAYGVSYNVTFEIVREGY